MMSDCTHDQRFHLMGATNGCCACELEKAQAEIERMCTLIAAIDSTLSVPAAEYVPAIGDVFTLIDEHRKGGRG